MPFDLTNQNISDTFQNLLQKTGSDNRLYDLEGNEVTDLRINGTLTADQYVVSSSVTNVTFQQQSGSTIFGDTLDDSHSFSGSFSVTGSTVTMGKGGTSNIGQAYIGPVAGLAAQDLIIGNNYLTQDASGGEFNYALYQSFAGDTSINTKTGKDILFTINTVTKAKIHDSGDFAVDTDTLYVDASTDRVGINAGTTPGEALEVVGNISASGAIDVGELLIKSSPTTSTSAKLIRITTYNASEKFIVDADGHIQTNQITASHFQNGGGILSQAYSYEDGTYTYWSSSLSTLGAISWRYNQTVAGSKGQKMVLTGTGHLGIGTLGLSPPEELTVEGNISSSGASYHSKHTFANDDATPSVAGGTYFETGTNSDTITTFDGGKIGQIIYVISKAAITYDVTSTTLKGGTTDIVTATSDLTSWLYDGSNWTLISYTDQSDNSN